MAVPLNSGYTPSGAAKIYYEEVGTGRPVLFCHAGVTDRRMWDPQFDNPVLGHRYIRSDMRGFGNSEWVAEAYRSHADILAVIEHLDLDDVVLVGCSMGGKAAMEVTVAAPERISGLVVIGAGEPGWEPPDGGYRPPQWDNLDPLWEAEDWDRLTEIDAEVWVVGVGRTRAETSDGVFQKVIEMDRTPIMTELDRDDYLGWMEPPIAERLDEISVPSLVVVGQYDLPDIVEGTDRLAKRISDQSRVVIADAAHLPSFEQPDAFNPLLESFLGSF